MIDPTKPENYRTRDGRRILWMAHCPMADPGFQIVALVEGEEGQHGFHMNGRLLGTKDHDLDILPHDPVLYYANVGTGSVGLAHKTVEICRSYNGHPTIARIAVHQSGRVRQIPLDATTDPENQA